MTHLWPLRVQKNVPFDEDLAGIILNYVPVTWVNQYNMMHSLLPKSPRVLLPDLEAIKHAMNEKHQANLRAKANEVSSASASAKGSPKKHSASGNLSERVTKQGRPKKFCHHCRAAPIWLTTPKNVASMTRAVIPWQRPQVSPLKQRSPSRRGWQADGLSNSHYWVPSQEGA
jgi:hypothetical protein